MSRIAMLVQLFTHDENRLPESKLVMKFGGGVWCELDYILQEDEYDVFELEMINNRAGCWICFTRTVGPPVKQTVKFITDPYDKNTTLVKYITCCEYNPAHINCYFLINMCIASYRGQYRMYCEHGDGMTFIHVHPLAGLL